MPAGDPISLVSAAAILSPVPAFPAEAFVAIITIRTQRLHGTLAALQILA
jgi:hypothetical protein